MRASVLLAAGHLALLATPASFRYDRPIEAAAGWARLELPEDVLDACRPGLPDLRLADAAGREIPFAFETAIPAGLRRLTVENLESLPKTETDAEVDRGPRPGFADAVTIETGDADFLKPVRVEASDDRAAWKEIARGSVFAAGGVRMTTLLLPPTDRRYLRLRLDDRNGDPVRLQGVLLRASAAAPETVEKPLPLQELSERAEGIARYAGGLPAANLDLAAIRFEAKDPAFSRDVQIYERVLFRDEVCRRLIAAGTISRAPGGSESLDVAVPPIAGRQIEIEIDGGDSPALQDLRAMARVRPRFIRFDAPVSGLRLLYGSAGASAPRYDLARALAADARTEPPLARLGPARATDASAAPVASAPRVPLPEPEKWSSRRPLRLADGGGVAYLDLYDLPRGLGDVRIVDAAGRQVPFIVEGGSHAHRDRASWKDETAGRVTALSIPAPDHAGAVEEVELRADAPEYFSRDVRIQQERRDARGPLAPRLLGTARWERRPGETPATVRVPIARPGAEGSLRVEIDNGDNAPVRVRDVWLTRAAARIDFVHQPGEPLFLYSGNAEARPPAYDLDLVAGAILASPARAAALGPAVASARARPPLGLWIWGAIAVTVFALLFELARTLPRRA